MTGAFSALLLALVLGTAGAACIWVPRVRQTGNAAALMVFLGLGIGLGVTAQIFFLVAVSFPGSRNEISLAAEGVLAAVALTIAWLRARRTERRKGDEPDPSGRPFSGLTFLLATLFAQMALVALVVAARRARGEPFGDWDGWAIWNLHARFLGRAPADWASLLRQPALGWSHPDYPMALPAAVARLWSWMGTEAGWAGGAISLLFAVATTGLLVAGLSRARRPAIGLIIGIVLMGTPPFVAAAASQQADIPVGFFLLAAVVLLTLAEVESAGAGGLGTLAGVCAGLATGVKNEGWLMATVIAAVWLIRQRRRSPGRIGFWIGLIGAMLPTLYYKALIAPRNDLVASQPWHRWAWAFDRERFELIAAALGHDLVPAAAVLVLLAVLAVSGRLARRDSPEGPAAAPTALVLGGMLGGYFLVYLVTPNDLSWYLTHSLDRLLLQLWPCALWLAGLLIPPVVSHVTVDALASRWKRTTWALGNGLLAGALVLLFSEQRAANEFSYAWLDGARVSAVLQQGWFPTEEDARDRWAWSGGGGALEIVSPRGRPALAVEFDLRSLAPRQVTIRWSRGVLWQGQVGTDDVHVRLRPVPFQSGEMRLYFDSREPAVPEGPGVSARRLAFAVYDLKVD